MACAEMQVVWKLGHSPIDIANTLIRLSQTLDMNESKRVQFVEEISQLHTRISNGLSSLLQLNAVISTLATL